MANTLSGGIQEIWAKRYQVTHHKIPVYPAVSNFEAASSLKKGDTYHMEYRSTFTANDVGSEGSFQRQDITDTDETLTISNEKESSFYLRDLDKLQNHLPTQDRYAYDAAVSLFHAIDGDVLAEYDNFSLDLDASDLGGTSGEGITVTTANVTKLFTLARKEMQRNNILLNTNARFTAGPKPEGANKFSMPVAIISPDVMAVIEEKLEGKDSALGDRVAMNGHGGRYMGFELFVSNNIAASHELAMATNPTDGDTIVINGVTITFRATLGAVDGDVHIASTVDITRANLAEHLNNLTTDEAEATDTGYNGWVANSDDEKALRGITATNDNTNDVMTIKMPGRGFVTVSETFTDATDTWTAAKSVQHCLIGASGAISVVVQKTPNGPDIRPRDGYIGRDIVTWAAYGIKVFNEAANAMVDVQVRTDNYS